MARRLLLLITVALLLRGWTAGAMTSQMLSQDLPQAAVVSIILHGPDCGATHDGAGQDDAASAPQSAGHCAQCHDCSLSALPQVASRLASAAPAVPATAARSTFSSAEPAPAVKPPIA